MNLKRTSFAKYPILWLTLSCFGCILLGYNYPRVMPWLCVSLFFLFSFYLFLGKRFPILFRYAFFILLLLVCTIRSSYLFFYQEEKYLSYASSQVEAILEIEEEEHSSPYYKQYRATVLEWNGNKGDSIQVILHSGESEPYMKNERIKGVFSCTLPQVSTYGFPNRLHLYSQGILLELQTTQQSPTVIGEGKDSILEKSIHSIRETLISRLSRKSWEGAPISKALLFGDDSSLPALFSKNISKIGATHLLAISGMHLVVFSSIFLFFLLPFSFRRSVRNLFLCVFLIFVCLITDSTPSVLRSAAMMITTSIFALTRKKILSVESISFVGYFFALFSPQIFLNVGFLLSYFATLGIITCVPSPPKNSTLYQKFYIAVKFSCYASLSAILFTAPIVAYFFGKISTLGVLSTLILSPICTLAIIFGVIALLLPNFLFSFSLISKILSIPAILMQKVSGEIVKIPHKNLYFFTNAEFIPLWILIGVILIFLAVGLGKKKIITAGLLIFSLLLIPINSLQSPHHDSLFSFTIHTEKSNDILLLSDQKTSVLIDDSQGDYALSRQAFAALSNYHHHDHLNAFVLLNYHPSLAEYFHSMLKYYFIETIYLPSPMTETENQIAFQIDTIAKIYNTKIHVYTVLDQGYYLNPNNNSQYQNSFLDIGNFNLCFERDSVFSINAYGHTIAYFNETWNRSQYQVERYARLYRKSERLYLLFSANAPLPTKHNLSETDTISYRQKDGISSHVFVSVSSLKPHKNFLFVA